MKEEDLNKSHVELPLPPPRLIELGSVRELVRGSGSTGFDAADECTTPNAGTLATTEHPDC